MDHGLPSGTRGASLPHAEVAVEAPAGPWGKCLAQACTTTCAVKHPHRAILATKGFFGKCQNGICPMSRPNPSNICDGCGVSLDRRRREHVTLGPIVHEDIWRQLAKPTEALCWECMLERARVRLGRMLRLTDLPLEPLPSAVLVVRPVR